MTMQQNIDNAKIDLITELGINELPQEKQDEILLQIGEILQQRIIDRFVSEMPEDKTEEFLVLIANDGTDQKVVDDFIAINLPKADEFILDEIGKYKEESIELFKQMSK
jgi:hypothetical protein